MTSVKSVLHRYAASGAAPTPGGKSVTAGGSNGLALDLEAVSRNNRVYFTICFASVLAALIGAGIITIRFLDSPQKIQAIFAVLGISITSLLALMTSLWKQKVSADLLLVLSRSLPDAELKLVIDKLLANL